MPPLLISPPLRLGNNVDAYIYILTIIFSIKEGKHELTDLKT